MISISGLRDILAYVELEYGSDVNIYIDIKGDIEELFNNRLLDVRIAKDGGLVLCNYE